MKEGGLFGFFEDFLNKSSLFKNKKALQDMYIPGVISHRDEQINFIASVIAPALRCEKCSNLLIYGKTGTGKTLTTNYVTDQIRSVASEREIQLKVIYINCKLKKVADTEYRLVAQLARELGRSIPPTGLPTEEVYNIFFDALRKEQKNIVLVLDEIDQLITKTGNELLYNLTRLNNELGTQLMIIGISNDITFMDSMDSRVKSSLSEEEIVFTPYNALQLQEILRQRTSEAFHEGVLEPGTIEKCAAYAAREHGDARRALELLRVAAEIAERDGEKKVAIRHLDKAEEKIEKDKIIDLVAAQPKQQQAVLYAIILACSKRKEAVSTGEIYEIYQKICSQLSLRPLTQRRISDIIAEFDMLGVINATVISKGRYGRTREISVSIPEQTTKKIRGLLEEGIILL